MMLLSHYTSQKSMIFVYFVSILAGALSGINESINKNITEKRYSAFSYSFIQFLGNLILYAVPFIFWGSIPKVLSVYIYILILVVIIMIGNLFLIKSYKTEDISNINIISRASLIITFLSGIMLLNEPITILKILGIISVICGILVIFYEGRKIRLTPGLTYAFFSGILFGLVAYFDKKALGYTDPLSLIFIFNLFSVMAFLFIPKTLKDVRQIAMKYKGKILLSRISAVSAFYLFLWSIKEGNISIVNTNFETAFLLAGVLIGILFLNEKKNISKKLAGSVLCILGIILLNFF